MLEVAFRLDKNTAEGLDERDETPTTRVFFLEARLSPQPTSQPLTDFVKVFIESSEWCWFLFNQPNQYFSKHMERVFIYLVLQTVYNVRVCALIFIKIKVYQYEDLEKSPPTMF